jgi:hypothetical protein
LTIAADGRRPAAVYVLFGVIPDRLVARLEGGAAPAQVRRAATAGLLRGPDPGSAVVRMTRDDQALLLGPGWSPVETDDAGPYRWTTAADARLVLPAAAAAWRTLAIEAFQPGDGGARALGIRVDGTVLPSQPVQAGWHRYVWTLPPGVAAALTRSSTELSLVVDGSALPRGVAVSAIRFSDGP